MAKNQADLAAALKRAAAQQQGAAQAPGSNAAFDQQMAELRRRVDTSRMPDDEALDAELHQGGEFDDTDLANYNAAAQARTAMQFDEARDDDAKTAADMRALHAALLKFRAHRAPKPGA